MRIICSTTYVPINLKIAAAAAAAAATTTTTTTTTTATRNIFTNQVCIPFTTVKLTKSEHCKRFHTLQRLKGWN